MLWNTFPAILGSFGSPGKEKKSTQADCFAFDEKKEKQK
jgi:hypothetical protein